MKIIWFKKFKWTKKSKLNKSTQNFKVNKWEHVYKTLGTSITYSPMSPPYLFFPSRLNVIFIKLLDLIIRSRSNWKSRYHNLEMMILYNCIIKISSNTQGSAAAHIIRLKFKLTCEHQIKFWKDGLSNKEKALTLNLKL